VLPKQPAIPQSRHGEINGDVRHARVRESRERGSCNYSEAKSSLLIPPGESPGERGDIQNFALSPMPREYRRAITRGMPPTFDAFHRRAAVTTGWSVPQGSADSRALASAPDTEREFRDRA